jgi:Spy/CpxP family protein refolding chaperone
MRQELVRAAVAVAAAFSLVTPCAIAEDVTGAPIEESLGAAKTRLHLTPEQEAKLAPLMRDHSDKTRAIVNKFGSTPTMDERQAKYNALATEQSAFRSQLAGVLTPEQLMEWDRARAEALTRAQQERIPDSAKKERFPDSKGY